MITLINGTFLRMVAFCVNKDCPLLFVVSLLCSIMAAGSVDSTFINTSLYVMFGCQGVTQNSLH